ncbi:MAG TPA: hypothetical protein VKS78_13900 [Roseiarcus sp.]|nr:hypothetical protein [Roseiarcus sp.]
MPPVAAVESPDPVLALVARFLEANREITAAGIAEDEFEPMHEWEKTNPKPVLCKTPVRDNVAVTLDGKGRYIDTVSGEALTDAEAWPGLAEAEAEYKEALRKWNRRRQAAERRTGYRKLQQASEEAGQRFFETRAALCDAIPLSWAALAAKACAFRKTHAESEYNLTRSLLRDVAVLSGEIDRASAPLLTEEELANA